MTPADPIPRLTVPESFRVNEGGGGRVIYVQGPTIRVEPPLGKSRTFSVREAARLMLHQPRGRSFDNILLDAQGQILCRFARMEKNGEVFLQYLLDQGVPAFRPDGQRLEYVPSADAASVLRFTLPLRHTAPVGMWTGLGMGLGMVLFTVGIPVTAMLGGPHVGRNLTVLLGLIIFSLAAPWVCVVATGQLFPPLLVLDGGRVWVLRGLRRRELRLEEMDCCRFQCSDECYVLYNKRGKPAIKFSPREDFASHWMAFLASRNITVRSEP